MNTTNLKQPLCLEQIIIAIKWKSTAFAQQCIYGLSLHLDTEKKKVAKAAKALCHHHNPYGLL